MASITKWLNNNSTISQVATHLRVPLFQNGYALMVSTAATSVLGIGYWVIAAHTYPTELVGRYSATIATMLFLAGAAGLSLDGSMVRFISRAGKSSSRLIGYSYLFSSITAIVLSSVFLLGAQIWSPALAFLKNDPWLASGFISGTVVICIFSQQDGALTGLRQATWVPVENSSYAVLKIVTLIAFSAVLPQYGFFASWIIPALVLIGLINLLIFRRLVPQHTQRTISLSEPLNPVRVIHYASGTYFSFLFYNAYLMVPPLMVLQMAGPQASAYFYLPWVIANSLRLLAANMSNSLIVEGTIDYKKTTEYFRRALINMVRLLVPLVLLLVLFGVPFLKIFGIEYSLQGIALFRLLLLGALPGAVIPLYIGYIRVQNRVGLTILIQGSIAGLMLTLSYFLIPRLGISGVGWAWLISQTLVAGIILYTNKETIHASQPA